QPGGALREALSRYLDATINADWPAMQQGGESSTAIRALDELYAALLTFAPGDNRGATLMAEILHQLDVLTQARRARLVLASGVVPRILWLVLWGGAVLTIGFTLFFGTCRGSTQAEALGSDP